MNPEDPGAARMIEHLTRQVRRPSAEAIGLDTPLVSSGLLDSFALVGVLVELERITGMRIPAGKVSPEDLDSVRKMFQTAERVGKPAAPRR
jgi:acyl carrier protein